MAVKAELSHSENPQILLIITLVIIISVILHIRAEYAKNLSQVYFFKPLTTLSIIVLCLIQSPEISMFYQYVALTDIVFSLGGDVFLMLPSDQFIKGLVSFLFAHICYIVAFSSEYGFFTYAPAPRF